MPFPTDEKLMALASDLLHQFDAIFGEHPGFRPAHAKGTMLTGTFTPEPAALTLSRAPHFTRESTPVTVRFSDSTGIPLLPDTDPNANPKGMAMRFHLAERVHTDIIAHSMDGFPTRTGADFLDFLRALAASNPANLAGSPLEAFLGSHPAALAFVQTPKPFPASFGTEAYFGVSALQFTSQDGTARSGRYRLVPSAGLAHLDEAEVAAKSGNFLLKNCRTASVAGRSSSVSWCRLPRLETWWMTPRSTGRRTASRWNLAPSAWMRQCPTTPTSRRTSSSTQYRG